ALARYGDVLGEHIRVPSLHLHADIERESVTTPVHTHLLRRYAWRQGHCRGHRHGQTLLGLAFQPQRERAGVTLIRAYLGVARVPDRRAVGGGGRVRLRGKSPGPRTPPAVTAPAFRRRGIALGARPSDDA